MTYIPFCFQQGSDVLGKSPPGIPILKEAIEVGAIVTQTIKDISTDVDKLTDRINESFVKKLK